MLADELDYVIGVDPHRDTHALAVVDVRSGGVVVEATAVADGEGYASVLRLADQHAPRAIEPRFQAKPRSQASGLLSSATEELVGCHNDCSAGIHLIALAGGAEGQVRPRHRATRPRSWHARRRGRAPIGLVSSSPQRIASLRTAGA
jgi:hypothetical protein